jgi:hypothetical protein
VRIGSTHTFLESCAICDRCENCSPEHCFPHGRGLHHVRQAKESFDHRDFMIASVATIGASAALVAGTGGATPKPKLHLLPTRQVVRIEERFALVM